MEGLLPAIFGACLAISFLLSGMEAGVLALSRIRIRAQMRAGNRRAEALHGYLEHPENFLWTILVGNTLSNFAALTIVAIVLHRQFASQPVLLFVTFFACVLLFYTLFELLPKILFRLYPNRLCMLLSAPVPAHSPAGSSPRRRYDDRFGHRACMDRRETFHRSSVRQSRRVAPRDAGIRPVFHERRTRDDQPRPRASESFRQSRRAAALQRSDGG